MNIAGGILEGKNAYRGDGKFKKKMHENIFLQFQILP